jgi:two-component system, OmpR family, phosphate regulon sensor histidine kinase PhoR
MSIFAGCGKNWVNAKVVSKPWSESVTDLRAENSCPLSFGFIMNFFGNLLAKKPETSLPLFELLKTMRESVVIADSNSQIIASNAPAYESFGRGNGKLENKRLSEVFRDLTIHEAFRLALENKQSSELKFEFSKRFFEVRISPFENNAIGIFYDITRLEQLENIRQEFLSNVSHELRTPLTSILAFVETLEDGAIDDEENNRRFLGVIRNNAARMHRLIDDISELSSIEAGKITIDAKQINLNVLIGEVFTNLSTKAKSRQIKLQNNVPKDVRIFADRFRLEQMMTNLIDNAIKFNHPDGSVTVSHKSNEHHDLLLVEDSGEGISNEHSVRIFERFYRTDKARSREIGGTGLGLAIVKHLALLHKGEVTVSSNLGKGSVFTIELPKYLL